MAIPQGITLEQLKHARGADKLSNWSSKTDSTYGRLSTGLKHHGFAGNLEKVVELNNAYLLSGNIGNDIQNYYDNHGNNATIDDFITHYNSNIDTLNNNWKSDPLNYNDLNWRGHNQLYKKMYHSRSNATGDDSNGNIGYDTKYEHILGSNTWLRNTDNYDKAWTDLTDEEKAARTHTITIGGKQYKVGKDLYGHLVKWEDPAPVQDTVQDPDPIVTPNETPKDVTYSPYDITSPKEFTKPKFLWHEAFPLSMLMFNNLSAASTIYNNNSLQKTPLLQGFRKVHKDTSNYLERSILENNLRLMMQTLSNSLANTNDPERRQFILGLMLELSQNTAQQATLFNLASLTNALGATEVANFNNYTENNVANTNMQNNVTAYNNLILNRNDLATRKAYYLNDWIGKTNDSYKEAVKGYRLNLLNIDIETAKFNNLVDLTNLQKKYDADLFNATYDKDNILEQLKHIVGPLGVNGGTTVRDQYYSEDLNQLDMEHLTLAINHLEYGLPLTTQDKAIIDKVIGIENDYNQKLFSGLNNIKADLKNTYDTDKLNLQLSLQDYLRRLNILISDQGFNPWRYKKGGKVDTSIINNAFKNFQKEQDSARKNSVENAKLRLSKLEKELDRIHEKLIFLLKQIYK